MSDNFFLPDIARGATIVCDAAKRPVESVSASVELLPPLRPIKKRITTSKGIARTVGTGGGATAKTKKKTSARRGSFKTRTNSSSSNNKGTSDDKQVTSIAENTMRWDDSSSNNSNSTTTTSTPFETMERTIRRSPRRHSSHSTSVQPDIAIAVYKTEHGDDDVTVNKNTKMMIPSTSLSLATRNPAVAKKNTSSRTTTTSTTTTKEDTCPQQPKRNSSFIILEAMQLQLKMVDGGFDYDDDDDDDDDDD